MQTGSKKTPGMGNRTYSTHAFMKRVVRTLTALVAVSSAVVLLLIYLPLKTELEKSLMDNFDRLSYISYASLQNNIDRGFEGARTLSSRTMIRNAILDYENGEMDMDELIAYTQPKYQDGAKVLEHLMRAERLVGDTVIAAYHAEDNASVCTTADRLAERGEISFAICLTGGHTYFAMQSPILSDARVIGYDKLVFDLSDQLQLLSTDTIAFALMYQDDFAGFSSSADMVRSNAVSSLFHRGAFYYQAFAMQDHTYFIAKQSAASLLEPVYRLSMQTLLAGVGVLLAFTIAVYMFVVRYATGDLIILEDSRRSLKEAVTEANMDPLTKAGARRFGEEYLTAAFERFQTGEPSPAILLFDIDNLKSINDTYGHSAGDEVIRAVAEAVQMNIRSGDMLLRWGGDEFVGIFYGLTHESVLPFAQKLLNTVSNRTIQVDAGTIHSTISVGISYYNEDDRDFMNVINRADRAMYQSKSEGRNKAHEL